MRAFYDSKSKLDDRGIKQALSTTNKYKTWLQVEAALALSQAEEGFIPIEAARDIAAVQFEDLNMDEMEAIKEKVGHGFVPFVKVLVNACGQESGKYVHYGVATQNIQQTTQLYITKQVHTIFKHFVSDILINLGKMAEEHADTVMAGRTHGRHAVPITYGFKVSVWISELLNTLERMEECEKRVFVIMMGGASGGYNSIGSIGPKIQERVAKRLGMYSMEGPSRNMHQMHIEYLMNLSLLCNTLHKMAEEVYYTGIEEFGEVSETFTKGTIGSSTMPQKINPKLAKGIISNAQKLYSLPATGLYAGMRMFEGDSSANLLFDGLIEEGLELTTEVLIRAEELSRTLSVDKVRMKKNLTLNKGLINSEYVMMKVAEKVGKDQAHEMIYDKAMEVAINGRDYYEVLAEDPELAAMFTVEELKAMIDPSNYTGLCSAIAKEMAAKAEDAAKRLKT